MIPADTKSVMLKTLFYVCCIMVAYCWYVFDRYKNKK